MRLDAFNFTNILINSSIFIPCKNISIVLQVTLPLTLILAMCFSKDIECSFIVYNPIEFIVDVQKMWQMAACLVLFFKNYLPFCKL